MRLLFCFLLLTSFRSTAQSISIELTGNKNILFVERKNLVTIKNLPAHAKIKLTHGNIVDLGNKQFYINEPYCSYPAYDTIIVYKGAEILVKKTFRLIYDGAPVVKINGLMFCDSVKPNDLYKNGSITIYPDSLGYRITSFEMTLIPRRGELIGPLPSKGTKLSSQQQDVVKRMYKGDVLYFENIKAECTPCSWPSFNKARLKTFITGSFDYIKVD